MSHPSKGLLVNTIHFMQHTPARASSRLEFTCYCQRSGKKRRRKEADYLGLRLVNKLIDKKEYRRKWKKVSSIICDNDASAITVKTSSS